MSTETEVFVLVCGGRDYSNEALIYKTLDSVRALIVPRRMVVVNGGAKGADAIARQYARVTYNVREETVPAEWDKHGNSAGPIRNQIMLELYPISLVIAFDGGRGTADMAARAKAKGLTVLTPV